MTSNNTYSFMGDGSSIISNFEYFTTGNTIANDGILESVNNTGVLNSQIYQYHGNYDGVFNRARLDILYKTTLPSQLMNFSAIVSNKQQYNNLTTQFLNSLGVTSPSSDPRLCCGDMIAFDNNGCGYYFMITDNVLYVLVERLAIHRTPNNNYYAYTYIIPVLNIQPNQQLNLELVYNSQSGMTWYVNNNPVFNLPTTQIGMGLPQYIQNQIIDLGGTPENVLPSSFYVGFANFTHVDALPINWTLQSEAIAKLQLHHNYYYPGTNIPVKFIYPNDYKFGLFGQGNILTVYKVSIFASQTIGV